MSKTAFALCVCVLLAPLWQGAATKASRASFAPNQSIPMWLRGPDAKNKRGARKGLRSIRIQAKQLKPMQLWDEQVGKTRRYLVLRLSALLQLYKIPKGVDLALLHFANKALIPYPLALLKQHKRYPVYVAFAYKPKGTKLWSQSFPRLSRSPKKLFRDVRPLRFSGNKIVVTRRWHPLFYGKKLRSAKGFNPWRHIDSLRGVEFVHRASYYKQFEVTSSARVKKGARYFQESCQFCHGVRKVGAAFGWDFVKPYPLYKHRKGMSLYYHIKYRSSTAQAHGVMMPAIKGMSRAQAFAVWYWLRAVAKKPLRPYRPPRAAKKRR